MSVEKEEVPMEAAAAAAKPDGKPLKAEVSSKP
jgi:hypothetical protein